MLESECVLVCENGGWMLESECVLVCENGG